MPDRRAALLPALALVVVASVPSLAGGAPTVRDASLTVDLLASGLSRPTQFVFLGPDDFLVAEKNTGRIQRVTAGTVVATVLDAPVNFHLDHGALGLALHPQFSTSGWVYVFFTESSTGADTSVATELIANRIYRYDWVGSTLVNPTLILTLPTDPGVFHSGGVLHFGPDAKLYVATGDMQRFGQNQNFGTGPGPDDTGTILRVNDDGSAPPDNPFAGQAGLERSYAYGQRNVYGMDFDPLTGTLWQTENGPTNYDEINLVVPGFNSGWNRLIGPSDRDPVGLTQLVVQPNSAYSDPELSFLAPQGITAVHFLESSALGVGYLHDLFSSEVVFGRVFHFDLNAARDSLAFTHPGLADLVADTPAEEDAQIFAEGFSGVTQLETGPDGGLYVLEHFSAGAIYRIRAKTLDAVTDSTQLSVVCNGAGVASVVGSFQVYGTAANLPVATMTTKFYLDAPLPQNELASFVDTALGQGADLSHSFDFSWPDSMSHEIVMVVDALGQVTEEFEDNNEVRVFEECRDYVVAAPEASDLAYSIRAVHPNPFNPRTTVVFELPEAVEARVEVFDVKGRRVRLLHRGPLAAGRARLAWEGTDDQGRAVASGSYLVRITSRLGVRSRSLTLLK